MNDHNNGHLRWVATYAGYYSGTNIVYPDGTTNGPFNTALAQSSDIDSDGDGIVNGSDPTPFFVSTNFNFTVTFTNLPPLSVRVQWTTIPLATNYIYYATNCFQPTGCRSPTLAIITTARMWPLQTRPTRAVLFHRSRGLARHECLGV